jgi:Ca2+-binding RTX toxin-like protein
VLALAWLGQVPAGAAPATTYSCFGQPATIVGTGDGEGLKGTTGPDVIVGLGGSDAIFGNGGDDLICAGGGSDTVHGGAGNDMISGGPGTDHIQGDSGNDVILGDAGNDVLRGGPGRDSIVGGGGEDTVDYQDHAEDPSCYVTVNLAAGTAYGPCFGHDTLGGIEDINGSGGTDNLTGDDSANVIRDFAGSGDQVFGLGGDDKLYGHSFNGHAPDDFADGGQGTDTCADFGSTVSCESTDRYR